MATIGEQVQDHCIAIAQAPMHEQPGMIHEVHQQFKPHGYTKKNITDLVARAAAGLQQQMLAQAGGDLIEEMNAKYFVMRAESKVRIGTLSEKELNGHKIRSLSMMTVSDFATLKANHIVAGATADKIWLSHPDRKEFDGFFTHPNRPPEYEGKLNLWSGFSVEPKKGSIKLLVDHIDALVGGDEKCREYILNWIAWGFQNPHKPIGTVIVFIGDQGTGKGILGNGLRSIWGGHGIAIRNQQDLVGKHNKHLLSACYAFVDEALFAGNKQIADVLKGLVTEPTLRVEPKFEDSYEVDNMLKMLCASNHEHAMQVEFSDRRYAVFGVPDTMKEKTKAYWKKLGDWFESTEGKAAILHHMLERDISEFSPEKDRPFTEFYKRQKLASLDNDWLWWRNVAQREKWSVGKGPTHMPEVERLANGGFIMRKSDVYDLYCQWAQGERYVRPVSIESFWINARRWLFRAADFRKAGKRGEQVQVVDVPSFSVIEQRLEYFMTHGQPDPYQRLQPQND